MIVSIYADETKLFTDDFININNIIYVEVPDRIVFDFFKKNILDDFRSETDTEEGLSDYAIFEDWLDEYTCDDTVGLWGFSLQEYMEMPLINGVFI